MNYFARVFIALAARFALRNVRGSQFLRCLKYIVFMRTRAGTPILLFVLKGIQKQTGACFSYAEPRSMLNYLSSKTKTRFE